MGLRIIYGKSGSGKSQYCFTEIAKLIKKEKKIYIITPEQFSFTAEKKLMETIDTNAVLNKANQGIQTLERYKKVFNNKLSILNEYEFNDIVTLKNVIDVIQRAEMVMRIADEIKKQIYELGEDGRLVKMQLEELIGGLKKEEELMENLKKSNSTISTRHGKQLLFCIKSPP